MEENEDKDDWQKMRLVNHFFNKQVTFVDDIIHWKEKDYWATPIEFIGTRGGDCEDFALAKYFTLKAMGVDTNKLRLMYVRALRVNQAHMVLIYSEKLSDMPLILDNINPRVLPANKRRDLKPVYSFNGDGLWLAKAKGLGKKVKGEGGVARWEDIVTRIENNEFKTNR
jgi:predicted transglutaminase-like cysteine proteinase